MLWLFLTMPFADLKSCTAIWSKAMSQSSSMEQQSKKIVNGQVKGPTDFLD